MTGIGSPAADATATIGFAASAFPVAIDDDVRRERWVEIRGKPEAVDKTDARP